jgi:DNA helicase-2/ATP-dependent DNA helicase PcrA
MNTHNLTLQQLWDAAGFKPNEAQERAILHTQGPLYLPAGPGSGKTRVLLWRTLNLIVFNDVKPQDIYLSTFTEKAALQLREGLQAYLGAVTHRTGQNFDISQMYVGTVHSLCHRIIQDRRFYPNRERAKVPALRDELRQYFLVYRRAKWDELTDGIDFGEETNLAINGYFGHGVKSRHAAVTNTIALFNRFSEECLAPKEARRRAPDQVTRAMIEMYERYLAWLQPEEGPQQTDLSLLQQNALHVLEDHAPQSGQVFKHVIVDEYQDTNTVQERLFFSMASGHKNICVVGDDDQALYRFRGATVENFVEFRDRCIEHLGAKAVTIPLATNYRSRSNIVSFYSDFIKRCDWSRRGRASGSYRVADKNIQPFSKDKGVSVVASTAAKPEAVCPEIAQLVRQLIDAKKVQDPNQIAFLFPSLKSVQVGRMRDALEAVGLRVYAPRAGTFLDVDESKDVLGLFVHVFGKPDSGFSMGHDHDAFCKWIDEAQARGKELMRADRSLTTYIGLMQEQIKNAAADYTALAEVATHHGWDLKSAYNIQTMKRKLVEAAGLTDKARKSLGSANFERIVLKRQAEGKPFTLEYIIRRATALDWSMLDLFYRLSGFEHFKHMFDVAECGEDEGPICNLGLLSQYLALFMDEYVSVITANLLADDTFCRLFFTSYLFALYRRGESEYEDAEDPFPRGRIPFLTIHQAKGLEFPVVVLGNPSKTSRLQKIEEIVQPLVKRAGEPQDRKAEFDTMRVFYVALSRAKNLLVIAHYKGQGQSINEPFKTMLDEDFPRIRDLDVGSVPAASLARDDLPRNYSYTGDYLMYQKCPRQYMIFRKYGFVPSRTQMMMFGSLVHRTMDDLHQYLISQKEAQAQ